MFSPQEQAAIAQKAIEQAKLAADVAKVEPELLLPVPTNWPFALTHDDRVFLKIQRIADE
jgi:hypothetical protein